MNTMLNLATDLAAAPQSASGIAAGGGVTLVGLIGGAVMISHWKSFSKDVKKWSVISALTVACLAGGGGVVGGLIASAQTTAGTVGTTLTQTTTGQ
jgi:hypothetical protein